ncbi:MAG TPA: chitobiase/beta-hexosaminidase C-terminal domain-containing protein, partial [Rubrobacteraceae bacterium]|nr:chitobiase/beta-hexosaminidase C-terminal domain-containing protein [Rubrobacteraceae bacterium]
RAEPSRTGPADANTGFPIWLEDSAGLRLEPCFTGENCSATVPDPSRPPSTPDNVGDHVVYWSAQASMPTRDGGRALLQLTKRGGFLPSDKPADGTQQVLNRIRIQVDSLVPGETYRVTHPYGVETFSEVNGGRRSIDFTEDVGCLRAPCGDFAASLNGRVDPWLTWDTLGAVAGEPPAGYIGDAATPHKVVGSLLSDADGDRQNYFKIEGPDVGGPGVDVIQTNLFVVEGKLAGLAAFANPKGGLYKGDQSVTLAASDPAAEIFYTTDGTEPTEKSTPYKGPLDITSPTTLKFVAIDKAGSTDGRSRSPVVTQIYYLD